MGAREVKQAFLVADLCGYTALTEAHGNEQAAHAVIRYAELARSALQDGARLVERVGDEVLVASDEAAAVVRTALALRAAVEREPHFPTIRSGLHAGMVAEQDGAYFGSALNLTARVAAHARGGQILCTAAVRDAAGTIPGVAYAAIGPAQFKNILDPVALFEIRYGQEDEAICIDPVCRMQIRRDAAPARLPFRGTTYHFCSFECAKAFTERPEQYATPTA